MQHLLLCALAACANGMRQGVAPPLPLDKDPDNLAKQYVNAQLELVPGVDLTPLFAGAHHLTKAGQKLLGLPDLIGGKKVGYLCCCKRNDDEKEMFCELRSGKTCSRGLTKGSRSKTHRWHARYGQRCIVSSAASPSQFSQEVDEALEKVGAEVQETAVAINSAGVGSRSLTVRWLAPSFDSTATEHPMLLTSVVPAYKQTLLPHDAIATGTIYLLRHGQSDWNVREKSMHRGNLRVMGKTLKDYAQGTLRDAPLTPQGQDEASASQAFFAKLASFPANQVQLAGSLLSRAYDTLLIATGKLWVEWERRGESYLVEQVPALMEFGGADTMRWEPLYDAEPVQMSDSSLGVDSGKNAKKTPLPGESFRQFYHTTAAAPYDEWLTSRPWVVRADLPRRTQKCDMGEDQMTDVLLYVVEAVLSGKLHVVLGTHSQLIRCIFVHLSDKIGEDMLARWEGDGPEEDFNLADPGKAGKVPNGAVVSFKLRVPAYIALLDRIMLRQLIARKPAGVFGLLSGFPIAPSLRISSPGRGLPYVGLLRLKSLKAKNFPKMDTFGWCDPYVDVRFGGFPKMRTEIEVSTQGENVEWEWTTDEKHPAGLPVASEYQLLRLMVMDSDPGQDEIVGEVELSVADVMSGGIFRDLELQRWSKKSQRWTGAGSLDVEVGFCSDLAGSEPCR